MYNSNLKMIQTFGQENSLLSFFCSPKIDHFLVSNKYFIINEAIIDEFDEDDEYHNRIKIINRSNGLVESSFVINEQFHDMQLYLDKFLITFDRANCFLKCYNFKGDLLGKISLDNKLKGSYISVLNKELFFLFYDHNYFIFRY
jgi:hypothetical protein